MPSNVVRGRNLFRPDYSSAGARQIERALDIIGSGSPRLVTVTMRVYGGTTLRQV